MKIGSALIASISLSNLECLNVWWDSLPFSTIDFDDFVRAVDRRVHDKNRRHLRSKRNTLASSLYVGESERHKAANPSAAYAVAESQRLNMELYESRCASVQRFVAMCVLFHETARRVESFFPAVSFGVLGYRIDRTHSMLRVASTASPVSGADVRERMERLQSIHVIEHAVQVISAAWVRYRHRETKKMLFQRRNITMSHIRERSGSSSTAGHSSSNSLNGNMRQDEELTKVSSTISDGENEHSSSSS